MPYRTSSTEPLSDTCDGCDGYDVQAGKRVCTLCERACYRPGLAMLPHYPATSPSIFFRADERFLVVAWDEACRVLDRHPSAQPEALPWDEEDAMNLRKALRLSGAPKWVQWAPYAATPWGWMLYNELAENLDWRRMYGLPVPVESKPREEPLIPWSWQVAPALVLALILLYVYLSIRFGG